MEIQWQRVKYIYYFFYSEKQTTILVSSTLLIVNLYFFYASWRFNKQANTWPSVIFSNETEHKESGRIRILLQNCGNLDQGIKIFVPAIVFLKFICSILNQNFFSIQEKVFLDLKGYCCYYYFSSSSIFASPY